MDISERKTLLAQIERATDKIERLETAIRAQTDFLDDIAKEPYLKNQCGCGAPVINDICADPNKHTAFLIQRLEKCRGALWGLRSLIACKHKYEWVGGGDSPEGKIEPERVCKHCGMVDNED